MASTLSLERPAPSSASSQIASKQAREIKSQGLRGGEVDQQAVSQSHHAGEGGVYLEEAVHKRKIMLLPVQ